MRPDAASPAASRFRDAVEVGRYLWRRAWWQMRRTPGLAVLSLLIGAVLWWVVTDAENPSRVDVFPGAIAVEPANVGEGLAVANVLPSLQVRISAPEDRWERVSAANFRAFVDLNGLDAREQQVPVRVEVVGISRVRVVETSPSTVLVNLEEVVTKQVPLTVHVVGTVPRGYELQRAEPERQMVDVSGAQSLVGLVQEASANVNVTGLTVGLDQTLALTPLGEGGEIRGVQVRPASARVSVAVVQSTLSRSLPLEADVTGQPAPGYRITGVRLNPPTLRVEGTIEVLQAFDQLRLPRVNVDGARGDVRTTVRPLLPEGVTAPGQPVVVVEVTVAPALGSLLMPLALEVTNVQPGLMVTRVNPLSVSATLEGPVPQLNTLTPGAVRATLSAAALGPGQYDIRVHVTTPEGITVREVQPLWVSVTLARP